MEWVLITMQNQMMLIQDGMYKPTNDGETFLNFLEGDGGSSPIQSLVFKPDDTQIIPDVPQATNNWQQLPQNQPQTPQDLDQSQIDETSQTETNQKLNFIDSEDSENESDPDNDDQSLNDDGEDEYVISKMKRDQNAYLKNFLVILSGWIKSYLTSLYEPNLEQIKNRFYNIASPRLLNSPKKKKGKTAIRKRKVYLNLKKLSLIFNDEVLKPHISNFLNTYFLRKLAISTTKNRACLLRFLPVLKQGLVEGRIGRLR